MANNSPVNAKFSDKYKKGDRVFAKLKGFCPWPAQVQGRADGRVEKYMLYFYGTYERAVLELSAIQPYTPENIVKLGNPSRPSKKFKKAMEEIQDDIDLTPLVEAGSGGEPAQKKRRTGRMSSTDAASNRSGSSTASSSLASKKDEEETETSLAEKDEEMETSVAENVEENNNSEGGVEDDSGGIVEENSEGNFEENPGPGGEISSEVVEEGPKNQTRFEMFRQNGILTDVTLRGIASGGGPREVYAHKVILAGGSPFFEGLFSDGLSTYDFPFPTEVLEQFVRFMYTAVNPVITEENLKHVMVCAQLFQFPYVFAKCRKVLEGFLAPANYKRFEDVVKALPPEDELRKQFMVLDFDRYSRSRAFIQLTWDQVQEFIHSMRGSVSSVAMLEAISVWVQGDIQNRQTYLLGLMQFVRLDEIPGDVLKNCLMALNSSYNSDMTSTLKNENSASDFDSVSSAELSTMSEVPGETDAN